jgi:hypothetical protein
MQEVAKTLELGLLEMLKRLRENHIDIIPIIEEELSQIVPQIIEDIIKSAYRVKVEGI